MLNNTRYSSPQSFSFQTWRVYNYASFVESCFQKKNRIREHECRRIFRLSSNHEKTDNRIDRKLYLRLKYLKYNSRPETITITASDTTKSSNTMGDWYQWEFRSFGIFGSLKQHKSNLSSSLDTSPSTIVLVVVPFRPLFTTTRCSG